MFWAGHNAQNKLTVFNLPENSNNFAWRDIDINSYSNADYSSKTPTGTNWLQGSNGFGLDTLILMIVLTLDDSNRCSSRDRCTVGRPIRRSA